MAAFNGESDITKPISNYGKCLKYREKNRENYISVDLYAILFNQISWTEIINLFEPINFSDKILK